MNLILMNKKSVKLIIDEFNKVLFFLDLIIQKKNYELNNYEFNNFGINIYSLIFNFKFSF